MRSRLSPTHRRQLEVLRRAYTRELPQKVQALADAVTSLPARGWDEEAFEAAYVLVHRLTGSSATFGFEPIRRAAATLEDLLLEVKERPARKEAVAGRFADLLAGLRDALSSVPPAGRAGRSQRRALPKAKRQRLTGSARR
ncbi:MAG TPA: Hpt domain-containing protein [Vicinamibacteria bacterium]|jgi:chemotaxis protein histidine kinase CheA|nr:Hpt domain-containing protein [Vicinamibacteria bacterium]